MLEAGIGQAEVVETVVERRAGDGDGETAISVKSDRPMRPGSWTWRKTTSWSGPWMARQARIRRSRVRLTPAPSSGCRRRISSKTATGRSPGAASRIGRISLCQTSASGSGRRRSRRTFLCEETQVLLDPVGACRAETGFGSRDGRVGLTKLHVQPHLAIGDVAAGKRRDPHRREETRSLPRPSRPPDGVFPQERAVANVVTPVGLRPPRVADTSLVRHPDCRASPSLIAARQGGQQWCRKSPRPDVRGLRRAARSTACTHRGLRRVGRRRASCMG